MELMARAQNIETIGNLIDSFVHAELYSTQHPGLRLIELVKAKTKRRDVLADYIKPTVCYTLWQSSHNELYSFYV
jgi:hypothetical protein